jgi:hypothetical protein
MEQDSSAPHLRKRLRLSLSKKDLLSPAGAELSRLLETVTTDGKITNEKANKLQDWLVAHQEEDMPGIPYLQSILKAVLRTGSITEIGGDKLYSAVEKVLPVVARKAAIERRKAAEAADQLRLERELKENEELHRKDMPVEYFDFMLAGCSHRGRPTRIRTYVREGKEVQFYREPDNQHGFNAIMVAVDFKHHIGYVPRAQTATLAPFFDKGYRFKAYMKTVLTGGEYRIPVVAGEVYLPEATGEALQKAGRKPVEFEAPKARRPSPAKAQSSKTGCLTLCFAIPLVVIVGVVLEAIVSLR